jgi:hypothetical protein
MWYFEILDIQVPIWGLQIPPIWSLAVQNFKLIPLPKLKIGGDFSSISLNILQVAVLVPKFCGIHEPTTLKVLQVLWNSREKFVVLNSTKFRTYKSFWAIFGWIFLQIM